MNACRWVACFLSLCSIGCLPKREASDVQFANNAQAEQQVRSTQPSGLWATQRHLRFAAQATRDVASTFCPDSAIELSDVRGVTAPTSSYLCAPEEAKGQTHSPQVRLNQALSDLRNSPRLLTVLDLAARWERSVYPSLQSAGEEEEEELSLLNLAVFMAYSGVIFFPKYMGENVLVPLERSGKASLNLMQQLMRGLGGTTKMFFFMKGQLWVIPLVDIEKVDISAEDRAALSMQKAQMLERFNIEETKEAADKLQQALLSGTLSTLAPIRDAGVKLNTFVKNEFKMLEKNIFRLGEGVINAYKDERNASQTGWDQRLIPALAFADEEYQNRTIFDVRRPFNAVVRRLSKWTKPVSDRIKRITGPLENDFYVTSSYMNAKGNMNLEVLKNETICIKTGAYTIDESRLGYFSKDNPSIDTEVKNWSEITDNLKKEISRQRIENRIIDRQIAPEIEKINKDNKSEYLARAKKYFDDLEREKGKAGLADEMIGELIRRKIYSIYNKELKVQIQEEYEQAVQELDEKISRDMKNRESYEEELKKLNLVPMWLRKERERPIYRDEEELQKELIELRLIDKALDDLDEQGRKILLAKHLNELENKSFNVDSVSDDPDWFEPYMDKLEEIALLEEGARRGIIKDKYLEKHVAKNIYPATMKVAYKGTQLNKANLKSAVNLLRQLALLRCLLIGDEGVEIKETLDEGLNDYVPHAQAGGTADAWGHLVSVLANSDLSKVSTEVAAAANSMLSATGSGDSINPVLQAELFVGFIMTHIFSEVYEIGGDGENLEALTFLLAPVVKLLLVGAERAGECKLLEKTMVYALDEPSTSSNTGTVLSSCDIRSTRTLRSVNITARDEIGRFHSHH